uniref:Uncharacterized protein n=1 Tax=Setaria italica TaxID=4555 RepID=K3XKD6_SETIT
MAIMQSDLCMEIAAGGLTVASDLEPGLRALFVGAGEVVLAGATEHDAGAGLGGGAVKTEVADAAVPLGLVRASLGDLGQPRLQVDDVVQRALRHTRLPGTLGRAPAAGTGAGVAADGRGRGGGALPGVRVPGPVLGVGEALAPLLLVRALLREPPPAAARAAPLHARLDGGGGGGGGGGGDRRLLAVVHHGHQETYGTNSRNGKESLRLPTHLLPAGANWEGSKQETPKARSKYHSRRSPESASKKPNGNPQLNAADHGKKPGSKKVQSGWRLHAYTLQRIGKTEVAERLVFQVTPRRSIAVDRGR